MNEITDNWIKAHVQMFDFFGGVTPMLVYDYVYPSILSCAICSFFVSFYPFSLYTYKVVVTRITSFCQR